MLALFIERYYLNEAGSTDGNKVRMFGADKLMYETLLVIIKSLIAKGRRRVTSWRYVQEVQRSLSVV